MAAIFADITDPSVATQLRSGSIGVIPTDTVYGLVCIAVDEKAVARLYATKKEHHKPGTLIAETIEQLESLGFKRRYLTATQQFWPGAVSILTPLSDPKTAYLRLGQYGLAVRLPDDKKLQALLKKTGPLLSSSANYPNKPPANTIEEAEVYFDDGVDFYVDGGDLKGRKPSTIIRVVDDAVEVLREGAVTIKNNGATK